MQIRKITEVPSFNLNDLFRNNEKSEPNKLAALLFSYFDWQTLLAVTSVNKQWKLLAESDTLWKPIYKKIPPLSKLHLSKSTYKERFLDAIQVPQLHIRQTGGNSNPQANIYSIKQKAVTDTVLPLENNSHEQLDESLSQVAKENPQITRLSITVQDPCFPQEGFTAFANHCTHLKELHVQDAMDMTNEVLARFAKKSKLTGLSLKNLEFIRDRGLEKLPKNTLKILSIKNLDGVTFNGIHKLLDNQRELQELTLDLKESLLQNCILKIASLESLRYLALSNIQNVAADQILALWALPNIEHVHFFKCSQDTIGRLILLSIENSGNRLPRLLTFSD